MEARANSSHLKKRPQIRRLEGGDQFRKYQFELKGLNNKMFVVSVLGSETISECVSSISHEQLRIVFNTGAIILGSCLKDYYTKGPYMLNNLLAVILKISRKRS